MRKLLVIEEWDEKHPRWNEALQVIETLGQTNWAAAGYAWHHSSHLLVAQIDGVVAGFLRFVVQSIGPENDHAPVVLSGKELAEAKILAFGVLTNYRRQGIGRALQESALGRARELGCYQVRSHSGGENDANHQLKLAMGFGVCPVVRGQDDRGVYFVMPLLAEPRDPQRPPG